MSTLARVLGWLTGHPAPASTWLEQDGSLYERSANQTDARQYRADRERYQRLLASGADAGALYDHVQSETRPLLAEQDDFVRSVGWLLLEHDQRALWQLVYLRYTEGGSYHLGDETRFLHHQPCASVERLTPT